MHFMKCLSYSMLAASAIYADLLVVESLNDSGPGTLREALSYVYTGDAIYFDEALRGGRIELESDLPPIQTDCISIVGLPDQGITIDGSSHYRIFDVYAQEFAASELRLVGGAHRRQGGVLALQKGSSAILQQVEITSAHHGQGRNPITVAEDASLAVTDVLFNSKEPYSLRNSEIALDESRLTISANIPLSFVVDAKGGAEVYKYGHELAVITPPPSAIPHHDITVTTGPLFYTGNLNGSCTVLFSGSFHGDCQVNSLVNLGTVQPGSSISYGEIHTGSYTVVLGTTEIKIDAKGNHDRIEAFEDIYLVDGGLTILPANGTYVDGTKYVFLKSHDKFYGAFHSVSAGDLDVKLNYSDQYVEIEVVGTQVIGGEYP